MYLPRNLVTFDLMRGKIKARWATVLAKTSGSNFSNFRYATMFAQFLVSS